MKSCPACNRTFDDTMTFCLVDGSVLSAPFDPKATQQPPASRNTDPAPTMMYPAPNAVHSTPPPQSDKELLPPPQTIASPASIPGAQPESVSPPPRKDEEVASQSAMKTIMAPPPEVVFGTNQREAFAAATPPDSQLTQTQSVGGKRLVVIGAAVLAVILVGGIVWLIQRTRTRNTPQSRAASQPAKQTENKPAPTGQSFTENVNGTAIAMVSVSGGTFLMGSPLSETGRDQDEGPQNDVTVPSFYMSKFEITQAQYKAVTGTNPSSFKGDDLPVESVSWNDAVEFCRKLSQMTGRQYSLPTEAEWEYAARAGTNGPYAGNLEAMTWYDANSGNRTHPAGQKEPNGFGLYDMYGNVWEWCQSKYRPYPYRATDGRENLQETDVRVMRGGSWESAAKACRSAYRRRVTPDPRSSGFRIILGAA